MERVGLGEKFKSLFLFISNHLLGMAVIGWQNDLLAAFVLLQPTPEEAFISSPTISPARFICT